MAKRKYPAGKIQANRTGVRRLMAMSKKKTARKYRKKSNGKLGPFARLKQRLNEKMRAQDEIGSDTGQVQETEGEGATDGGRGSDGT